MNWLACGFCLSSMFSSNLLTNTDFEAGLDGWTIQAPETAIRVVHERDRTVATISITEESEIGFHLLAQSTDVVPGMVLSAKVRVMGRATRKGYGAYMALEFYNAEGRRIHFSQSPPAASDGSWCDRVVRAVVPPKTVRARLCLLLNGCGTASFDTVQLRCESQAGSQPLDGPVTVTVTDEVVCESFFGFGVEDDGWFYNRENASHGVDEQDIVQRETRVAWMEPDWVRMFFWHRDWLPEGNWESTDYESENMLSHYRTLDLYQRLGARVNVAGVEWGMKDPYARPELVAEAIGSLLEHLVRGKGYTCIRYWTLTNEPDTTFEQGGGSFENFVLIHRLVKQEFERRGLDIQIVGSDEALGLPWFQRCVENRDYFETVDLFASHRYFPYQDRVIAAGFFQDRIDMLDARSPRKPLIMGEFGFHDSRSGVLVNPVMETYPYAIWTADMVIQGLNRGVAGFSVWCLHEVYYPGNGFMNYGLWDFKDNDWRVRPVYHVWSDFCRATQGGERVYRCISSHPGRVRAARVGDTLFWVNHSDDSVEVKFVGAEAKAVQVFAENSLHGDRECGERTMKPISSFNAPPQSFGHARF